VSSEQAIGADAVSSWMDEKSFVNDNDDETDVALVEGRKALLPPFDVKSASVEHCFDTRSYVGDAEWGSISRQCDSLKSVGSGWLDQEPVVEWFPYITRRLGTNDKDALIDLILLRHLMVIFNKNSKVFRGPLKDDAKALGIPTDVMKYGHRIFPLHDYYYYYYHYYYYYYHYYYYYYYYYYHCHYYHYYCYCFSLCPKVLDG
jgi:hypothetical protein